MIRINLLFIYSYVVRLGEDTANFASKFFFELREREAGDALTGDAAGRKRISPTLS
jgi:hypothetical protein